MDSRETVHIHCFNLSFWVPAGFGINCRYLFCTSYIYERNFCMKSEKKDNINNQETTATQYKKPNQKMIDRYLQSYEKAKEDKDIKACYLGLDR